MSTATPTFAFSSATLRAPSLHALLGNLQEIRLHVTDEETYCTGIGYRQEVAAVFGSVLYYWEAITYLRFPTDLPRGTYSLERIDETIYVRRAGELVAFPDGVVEVLLRENREEEE